MIKIFIFIEFFITNFIENIFINLFHPLNFSKVFDSLKPIIRCQNDIYIEDKNIIYIKVLSGYDKYINDNHSEQIDTTGSTEILIKLHYPKDFLSSCDNMFKDVTKLRKLFLKIFRDVQVVIICSIMLIN